MKEVLQVSGLHDVTERGLVDREGSATSDVMRY